MATLRVKGRVAVAGGPAATRVGTRASRAIECEGLGRSYRTGEPRRPLRPQVVHEPSDDEGVPGVVSTPAEAGRATGPALGAKERQWVCRRLDTCPGHRGGGCAAPGCGGGPHRVSEG